MSFNGRQLCLWIHRYTGLIMAGFLILAGLTGSLLAFHDELDDWFNRDLAYIEPIDKPQLPISQLHDNVVATYSEYKFSSMPTSIALARSAVFSVDRARGKKTSTTSKAPFQEVYLNPYTGDIIGTRDKDEWAWRNTMWKVFWLHRDLLLGDIGKWLLGIVSLIWTMNCFIGFYLTLPRTTKKNNKLKSNSLDKSNQPPKKRARFIKRWLPAWKIRRKTNTFKFNYDLHQAFGLWLWLMLFVIAWSSVGFNLRSVYQPVMQALVGLEPRGEGPKPSSPSSNPSLNQSASPRVAANILSTTDDGGMSADYKVNKSNSITFLSQRANIVAQKNNVEVEQLLGLRWVEEDKQWQMRFKTNRDIGKKGGASSIAVDATTGNVERVNFGYKSSFGNKTDQWLSTLHMGHIGNGIGHVLYQIFLALIGLAVAILSGTGGYLWWRSRQSRLKQKQKLIIKNDFANPLRKIS